MPVALLTHPSCRDFNPGDPHPELPARIDSINDHLISLRLMDQLEHRTALPATDEQLQRVHDKAYLQYLQDAEPAVGSVRLDGDTWLTPGALLAARHAAGAAAQAVDLVMEGRISRSFCAVRPPGHHAERARAMGFCFFNNVAVAAAQALYVHGLKRVAIVDFDAHWGNGTDGIFRDEKRVSIFATFQEHLFPAMEVPSLPGRIHNVALAAGTRGRDIRQVYHDALFPALDAFRPQLILVSAGFDGHHEDAMSDLLMNEDDYAWLTEHLVALADRHCEGRLVSVLEGGYALSALGRSVAAHIRALLAE